MTRPMMQNIEVLESFVLQRRDGRLERRETLLHGQPDPAFRRLSVCQGPFDLSLTFEANPLDFKARRDLDQYPAFRTTPAS